MGAFGWAKGVDVIFALVFFEGRLFIITVNKSGEDPSLEHSEAEKPYAAVNQYSSRSSSLGFPPGREEAQCFHSASQRFHVCSSPLFKRWLNLVNYNGNQPRHPKVPPTTCEIQGIL